MFFCNLGDGHSSSGGAGGDYSAGGLKDGQPRWKGSGRCSVGPKNLLLIPFTVARALQVDGWTVRQAFPWTRGSSMPESVTDRPITSHEYWFMLTKKPAGYYWDGEAVRVAFVDNGRRGNPGPCKWRYANDPETGVGVRGAGGPSTKLQNEGWNADGSIAGRGFRTIDTWRQSVRDAIQSYRAQADHLEKVLLNGGPMLNEDGEPIATFVNPKGTTLQHFASYSPDLIRPFIRAGSSERGVCPACGAPYWRVVEKERRENRNNCNTKSDHYRGVSGGVGEDAWRLLRSGCWNAGCQCNAGEPIPAVVCDPFSGSSTTGVVCIQEVRRYQGIEANPEYVAMSIKRLDDELQQERLDFGPAPVEAAPMPSLFDMEGVPE